MQASIRRTDRCVIQFGIGIGPRDDCDIVELTDQNLADLSAALAVPHGNVYLAADGTVTADPFVPAPPPADQVAFDNAIAVLRTTYGTVRTAAQANATLDALTVVLRRVYRELK